MKYLFKLLFALLIFLPFLILSRCLKGPEVEADYQFKDRWSYIVIHHSGRSKDTLESIDKFHKEKRKWDGIGYHFIIGNGVNSKDGRIRKTFRYSLAKDGAHALTSDNFYNQNALGICLIGNFNKSNPSLNQKKSLVKLILDLQGLYEIPLENILFHNDTKATECPGENFPKAEILIRLKNKLLNKAE